MLRPTLACFALLLAAGLVAPAAAQPPAAEDPGSPTEGAEEPGGEETDAPAPGSEEEGEDPDEGEGAGEEEGGAPRLRPPSIEPLAMPALTPDPVEADEPEEGEAIPTPGEAHSHLDAAAPTGGVAGGDDWTAPQIGLTLHGYFRVRGELQDTFWLGRRPLPGDTTDLPFSRFRPLDNRALPAGGCGDEPETTASTPCDTEALSFANMRFRLSPTLSLGDDVRIHATFDVFDNMVLGSTPDGYVLEPTDGGFETSGDAPRVPLDSFAYRQQPPTAYRNSLSNSIVARRAWAEVRNRDLGELRFGRMGEHWGLGLMAHGGEGIDADFSTDVDRVMLTGTLAGLNLVAAYDFASEGFIRQNLRDVTALPFDAAQADDVDQYVLAVARQMPGEEQQEALARGDMVLNGGLYFSYRDQLLTSQGMRDPLAELDPSTAAFVRRGGELFTPDVWVQFLYENLRLELEAVLTAGSIDSSGNVAPFVLDDYGVLQFGAALEAEYRLLDDKLGIYFDTGLATGDSDEEGLAVTGGFPAQGGDDALNTFRFHPSYRVDLILWRNILGQVAGAYYFKPGVSYDFIRDDFGQLFGGRLDVIWSRASAPVQTWGNDPDLGIEIDASLYYRSEDGPDVLDGFYSSLQYGVLFPMKGLGYLEDGGEDQFPEGNPDLETAMTLRLILGVEY